MKIKSIIFLVNIKRVIPALSFICRSLVRENFVAVDSINFVSVINIDIISEQPFGAMANV